MGLIRIIRQRERLPDSTYAELVCEAFATRIPTTIMTVLFIGAGLIVRADTPDGWTTSLLAAGIVMNLVRLALLYSNKSNISGAGVAVEQVEAFEAWFAASYLLFAALLGAFAAYAVVHAGASIAMLMATLVVGYGAGVGAGMAARPWIAVPSILLATVPFMGVIAAQGDLPSVAVSVSMCALMVGAIMSLLRRYRSEADKITTRRMFSKLARQDHLTGLPNRLSLAEHFTGVRGGATPHAGVAVYCLDLDGFKAINDLHGHPVGDAILIGVAERLKGFVPAGGFAARLGGDEFVFVQTGVADSPSVEATARQLAERLSEPYAAAHGELVVEATIGYALTADRCPVLESTMRDADAMLIRLKEQRRGGTADATKSRLRVVG